MKIDLERYVLSKDGLTSKIKKPKAVPQDDGTVEYEGMDSVFFTIGKALEASLLSKNTLDMDKELGEDEVLKRYELFLKINGQKEVEVNQEEVNFLKDLVIKMYDIFFSGEIVTYLNSL